MWTVSLAQCTTLPLSTQKQDTDGVEKWWKQQTFAAKWQILTPNACLWKSGSTLLANCKCSWTGNMVFLCGHSLILKEVLFNIIRVTKWWLIKEPDGHIMTLTQQWLYLNLTRHLFYFYFLRKISWVIGKSFLACLCSFQRHLLFYLKRTTPVKKKTFKNFQKAPWATTLSEGCGLRVW